jgi:DNA-directed RNA polymerase subunit RPC12/RpoP
MVLKGEEVSEEPVWWRCACGKRLQGPEEEVLAGTKRCPHCGSRIFEGQKEPVQTGGPEETQMVDLGDMAEMAQDGLDLAVSDEWDTSTVKIDDDPPD